MMIRFLIPLSLAMLTFGCAIVHDKEAKTLRAEGIVIMHSPGNMQSTYVNSNGDHVRLCTETDVDFSKTSSSGVSLGFASPTGSEDDVGLSRSKGAALLGGRDPAVLIARELMFRACEFMSNVDADQKLSLKVYAGTLDAIVRIAQAQTLVGTAGAENALVPSKNSNTSYPARSLDDSDRRKTRNTPKSQSSSGFDWTYDWDYKDDQDDIDASHP